MFAELSAVPAEGQLAPRAQPLESHAGWKCAQPNGKGVHPKPVQQAACVPQGVIFTIYKLSPWRGGPNYSFFIFPHFSAQEAKKDVKKEKGNSYHVVTGILENEEQCSIRNF